MSRIRSVHPGLWTDEIFVSVSFAARILTIGIWGEADDKGIFVWSPLQLKMRLMPADNTDVSSLLSELESVDIIRRYEVSGKSYGAIRNFAKYQRPKKPNNIHPAPADVLIYAGHSVELAGDELAPVPNQLPTSGEKSPQMEDEGGREGLDNKPDGSLSLPKQPPKKSAKPKLCKSLIPDSFFPEQFSEGTQSRSIVDGWPPGEIAAQIEAFTAHHRSHGKQMTNWQDAWSTWVINSRKFGRSSHGTGNNRNAQPKLGTTGAAAERIRERLAAQERSQDELFRIAGDDGGQLALPAK